MNIKKLLESVLSVLFDSYFHGMPDFGEGQEPEIYAVYTLQHKPESFVSGRKTTDAYFIMLSVFTPVNDTELYDRVENALTRAGFLYQGGREVGLGLSYPQKFQYSMDFIGYEGYKSSLSEGGSSDYNELYNKPQIEGVTLIGNKGLTELGLRPLSNTEIKKIADKLKI